MACLSKKRRTRSTVKGKKSINSRIANPEKLEALARKRKHKKAIC